MEIEIKKCFVLDRFQKKVKKRTNLQNCRTPDEKPESRKRRMF